MSSINIKRLNELKNNLETIDKTIRKLKVVNPKTRYLRIAYLHDVLSKAEQLIRADLKDKRG